MGVLICRKNTDRLGLIPGPCKIQGPLVLAAILVVAALIFINAVYVAAEFAAVAAELDADGWVIALGDMPHVRPDTIRAVVEALEQGAPLVVPVFAGQRGHPVGFGRGFRDELVRLTGDAGARVVLMSHASAVHQLEVDDPGVVQDMDTPADAARLVTDD
jgi:molybdenum cofactor cytidylyltransferase